MAYIHTFKAVRPAPEKAHLVASQPYDVLNYAEAREITKNNPYSFLHIGRAETDLEEGTDPHSKAVYDKAAENLNCFISNGVLIQDENPCLYIYRLSKGRHSQTGLVCCTSVNEYLEGKIKKHELTRPEKETDRMNHISACNAHTGPVFLAYKAEKNDIIDTFTAENPPLFSFESEDSVTHTVWKIDDEVIINSIQSFFSDVPALYIADGHHRAASAVNTALKKKEENPNHTGKEEYNFFLSVIFPSSQLEILDYNRAVKDLNGLSEKELLKLVSDKYTVTECTSSFKPEKVHQFGMFLGNKWYCLYYSGILPDETDRRLDVSLLYDTILSPILGIGNQRTDKRIDFIGGIRGLKELENRVLSGEAKVAFALFPTSVDELMEIADRGLLMPPKSTWFEPKLKSGLFIHKLD